MARTDQQNEQMREARKESIRNEALNQFATKGLFATSIQNIAKGANMAQGLLYHYYPSKEAIYVDLIQDALEKLTQASKYVQELDTSAKEKILFALQELFKTIQSSERFRQSCCLIAQATYSTEMSEEASKDLEAKRNIPYQIMAEIMRQGQKEGSVIEGDPDALAILFWTSVNGIAIYCASHKNSVINFDYRLLAAMFLTGRGFLCGEHRLAQ